jgi:TolB protein
MKVPGQKPPSTTARRAPSGVRNGLVAFSAPDSGNHEQIFVTDGADRPWRQLTFDGDNKYPAWSADGRTIAFSANRTGHFEIYTMGADGSGLAMVPIAMPSDKVLPRISPDGTQLAFAGMEGVPPHPEVWTCSVSGANPRRLTSTPPGAPGLTGSSFPRFSPDGRRLLYASTAKGSIQIWVMNVDGTQQTQLTSGLGADFPDANAPNWSPTGDRIVFWAGHEGRYGDVWVMNADGSRPVQLTDQPGTISSDNPFWAPDGTQILFDTNRNQRPEIWVMAADGSGQREMIPIGIGNTQFSWQPLFDH